MARSQDYPARLKEIDDQSSGALRARRPHCRRTNGRSRSSARDGRRRTGARLPSTSQPTSPASGITVVSGLARGIDARRASRGADRGRPHDRRPACGLDIVYPPEHAKLAAEISRARRADLATIRWARSRAAEYFPRRNRILSAISLGVLVVEGDVDSGR